MPTLQTEFHITLACPPITFHKSVADEFTTTNNSEGSALIRGPIHGTGTTPILFLLNICSTHLIQISILSGRSAPGKRRARVRQVETHAACLIIRSGWHPWDRPALNPSLKVACRLSGRTVLPCAAIVRGDILGRARLTSRV